MKKEDIAGLIRSWQTVDPDELGLAVAQGTLIPREILFTAVLSELHTAESDIVSQLRLCAIAREMLATQEPVIGSSCANEALSSLSPLLLSTSDESLVKSLLVLLGQVANRVALHDSEATENLSSVLRQLQAKYGEAVRSSCERFLQRLTAMDQVFTRKPERMTSLVTSRRSKFSEADLNVAARNVRGDATKDWHTDPWDWFELDWLRSKGASRVLERMATNSSGYVVKIDVAKNATSTRPALVMDPLDRLAYQGLIDLVSLELVGHLPDWVYGWRLDRGEPEKGKYADNSKEWQLFNAALSHGQKSFRHVLRVDVRNFFSSISPELLIRQIIRQCKSFYLFDRIEHFLYSWNGSSKRTGLPQRFLPSSLLAHAFVRPLDDFLGRLRRVFQGRLHVARWMDDIWLFADDRTMLNQSLKELSSLLEQLGLEFNSEKTRWLDTQALGFTLLVSESSGNIKSSEFPAKTIADQVDSILEHAEEAPRARFGILNSSTISDLQVRLLKSLEPNLNQFPHIADFLANAIRLSRRWGIHEEWYVNYLGSQVSPTDWSVEAWAKMFPMEPANETRKVADTFMEKLGDSLQTTVLPLTCHRLASWRPAEALGAFTKRANASTSPFELRAIALAAYSVNSPASFAEECLGASKDTSYLIDILRSGGFMARGGKGPRPLPDGDNGQ